LITWFNPSTNLSGDVIINVLITLLTSNYRKVTLVVTMGNLNDM